MFADVFGIDLGVWLDEIQAFMASEWDAFLQWETKDKIAVLSRTAE